MLVASDWKDFELIDAGNGEKLERWGKYILRRPDPQAIWPVAGDPDNWEKVHAHYHRSRSGGGSWEFFSKLPEDWSIKYKELSFNVHPTGFKHTGLFPEQAANWDWIIEKIKNRIELGSGSVKVLNLFAYTGGATVAAAYAGAEVCHVDAAKGMVLRAKANLELSGLGHRTVRFITDDVIKFTQREKRREHFYDAIIMDPPSYGRGPDGEMWKLEDNFYDLIQLCQEVLSENPLFFLINTYTTGLSPVVLKNILELTIKSKHGGRVSSDEIGLPISSTGLILPCGAFGRWER
ncbi:MAG TPA: class I SAM-dependent methyltransferase [Clostridiales bacterium]|nr:class I SAM-dependent methyltransferase [Clostridiales bacterium]